MKLLKRSWHSLAFRRERKRRYAMRALLLMLAFLTALQVHQHDSAVYGGDRSDSDPVALLVFVVLTVVAVWLTRPVW